ncbi:glutathione S-transferase 1-like [Uranotaenia lowii]|uniref:glutathione S-transferase 1-like n=1 Tax=Uranotaenia lowii TaxID=190385 RepID=UPI00247ADFE2|nr:glutathione S-transferase 1-like [Uranotaenia lowii]XP_055596598.1 glutathione S-transferase 1-like [Uranotaenia lowii]
MAKVVLYTTKVSPPGRSVELTAKVLGLELEVRPLNLIAGEHLDPEFVKLNPQHTVPLIIDEDGTIVRDSHAINIYLSQKYGDGSLYPQDIVTQSKINAALHFDSGVLFARLRFYLEPVLFTKSTDTPQEKIDYIHKAYQLLNDTIVDKYIVGNRMTLADLSCITSIASMHAVFPVDAGQYPNLGRWMAQMAALPYYKRINQDGAEDLAAFFHAKLAANQKEVE